MNNPIIISTGIAVIGLVLSIFVAAWPIQNLMNKRIDHLKMYLDAKFDSVDAKFRAMDARFAAVDQRFSAIESSLDRIERQLETILQTSPARTLK